MSLPDAIEAGDIFPDTTTVDRADRLSIGGCDLVDLAAEYGTPLYVYDEATIRARARAFREALRSYPARSLVCYASKAYCAPWLLRIVADEGRGLDAVSGGELHAAIAANFPRDRIYVHGNNKDEVELEQALAGHIGRVVVDNLAEIELLGRLARTRGMRQPVLIRVGPGVDTRTHAHVQTGGLDTKFGLDIASGAAAEGVKAVLAQPSLDLRGLHAHIGSQIHDIEPYARTVERLFGFAAEMTTRHRIDLREVSPGGGYGVRYTTADPRISARDLIAQVAGIVVAAATSHGSGSALPDLTIEPGRSLVASAAVALYTVGSIKTIPGVRTYVAVNGGMADNIRPMAYGSNYSAVLAGRVSDGPLAEVAIAGRYCESGDVLIREARIAMPRLGDVVAIPTAGAYQLSMASNYNMALRPAVILVNQGRARLVRRRETFADLLAADL